MLYTGTGGHNATYINEKYEGKLNVQHISKSIIYPFVGYLAIIITIFQKKNKQTKQMKHKTANRVILIFYKCIYIENKKKYIKI